METITTRRSFIGVGIGAAAAGLIPTISKAGDDQSVPFSSGTAPPRSAIPANACDCHIHIISTKFPASSHWKGEPVVDSVLARLPTPLVIDHLGRLPPAEGV